MPMRPPQRPADLPVAPGHSAHAAPLRAGDGRKGHARALPAGGTFAAKVQLFAPTAKCFCIFRSCFGSIKVEFFPAVLSVFPPISLPSGSPSASVLLPESCRLPQKKR